ncbi:unnamed protein product [Toxocara canis]|uniref:Uncharacterized protein n=1 Tax=Toxocara canis TaxID=6265 RepID=A0A183UCH8_TOXCA|nr:unnamed protein product [Toxocara canis]
MPRVDIASDNMTTYRRNFIAAPFFKWLSLRRLQDFTLSRSKRCDSSQLNMNLQLGTYPCNVVFWVIIAFPLVYQRANGAGNFPSNDTHHRDELEGVVS